MTPLEVKKTNVKHPLRERKQSRHSLGKGDKGPWERGDKIRDGTLSISLIEAIM
jgi:hypothetical protein